MSTPSSFSSLSTGARQVTPWHTQALTASGTIVGLASSGGKSSAPGASASNAFAQEALAKKYNCLACHSVDKKLVGPAYQDVAAKYKGDAGAEAKLVAKVKNGGAGVWGQIPMPPNSTVPDADVKALVKWVLSLKK